MTKRTKLWSVVALAAGGLLGYGAATGRLTWDVAAHAAAQDGEAAIPFEVLVPADAALEIGGVRTTERGVVRHFTSPPLRIGGEYTYTVKATAQGKTVARELNLKHG